jgi:hypothetical protein
MRGAYIAQINRLIFVNNFLILAKVGQPACPAGGVGIFGPRAETCRSRGARTRDADIAGVSRNFSAGRAQGRFRLAQSPAG